MTVPASDAFGGEMARVRHDGLDVEQNVPRSALPILVASGWQEVSKKDAAAAATAEAEALRKTEDEMTAAGLAAIPEHVRREAVAMQVNMADAVESDAAKAETKKSGGK